MESQTFHTARLIGVTFDGRNSSCGVIRRYHLDLACCELKDPKEKRQTGHRVLARAGTASPCAHTKAGTLYTPTIVMSRHDPSSGEKGLLYSPFGDISDMPVRMFAALGGARRRCSTLARLPWMTPVERMRQIGQAVGPWHQKQCLWPRGRQVRFSETGAAGHAVSCSKLCMAARLSAAVGRTACCDIMCDCQCAQVSRISTEAALDVLCACPTQPTRGQLSGDCRADDTGGRANGTFSLWTLR